MRYAKTFISESRDFAFKIVKGHHTFKIVKGHHMFKIVKGHHTFNLVRFRMTLTEHS
jgi:hypothetical protein